MRPLGKIPGSNNQGCPRRVLLTQLRDQEEACTAGKWDVCLQDLLSCSVCEFTRSQSGCLGNIGAMIASYHEGQERQLRSLPRETQMEVHSSRLYTSIRLHDDLSIPAVLSVLPSSPLALSLSRAESIVLLLRSHHRPVTSNSSDLRSLVVPYAGLATEQAGAEVSFLTLPLTQQQIPKTSIMHAN